MRLLRPLPFVALLLLASAHALSAQVLLQGRVADERTGAAIGDARVVLIDGGGRTVATRITATDGSFDFFVRRNGPYLLRATHIGYRENTSPRLWLGEHRVVRVELRLDAQAILLAPLEVIARSASYGSPVLANFHARLASGMGTVVTRAEIERRRPARVSDVLASLPGVRLESAGGAGHQRIVYLRRDCPAQIFVDGFLLTRRNIPIAVDDVVSPGSVEGIEIFRGFATVPAEFLDPQAQCGVVAIWTRRGG